MIWDSENIRELRRRLGWSQADLARRLKMNSAHVGQIEMGLEEPDLETTQSLELLSRLADSLAADMVEQVHRETFFE
jgi:transcriptional regulator with XRE-family HTH domain